MANAVDSRRQRAWGQSLSGAASRPCDLTGEPGTAARGGCSEAALDRLDKLDTAEGLLQDRTGEADDARHVEPIACHHERPDPAAQHEIRQIEAALIGEN